MKRFLLLTPLLLTGCFNGTPDKGASIMEMAKFAGETFLMVSVCLLAFYAIWFFFDELRLSAQHYKQVILSRIWTPVKKRGRNLGIWERGCDDPDEPQKFTQEDLDLAGREILAIAIFAGLALLGLWVFLANLFEPI